jgi:hypothetical protein
MLTHNSAANRLVRQCIKPALRHIWPWRHKNLNGIRVNYLHHLDGGGAAFGQDYIPYLRNRGMPARHERSNGALGQDLSAFLC